MGMPIARNLIMAGFNVSVYNRTKVKADLMLVEGAKKFNSPKK